MLKNIKIIHIYNLTRFECVFFDVKLHYTIKILFHSKWFPESKGQASSAILFGYGGSAVMFNQIQTLYINPNNYSPDKPYSPEFPDEK